MKVIKTHIGSGRLIFSRCSHFRPCVRNFEYWLPHKLSNFYFISSYYLKSNVWQRYCEIVNSFPPTYSRQRTRNVVTFFSCVSPPRNTHILKIMSVNSFMGTAVTRTRHTSHKSASVRFLGHYANQSVVNQIHSNARGRLSTCQKWSKRTHNTT